MHVKKNDDGNSWEAFVYVDDITGKRKLKHRRGFKTKREAVLWAEQVQLQKASKLDMSFKSFWEIYRRDMKERLRENTIRTKDYIVELKILPYFANRKMNEISASDIRNWQTELIKANYSQTYLRTINNQLSAIFNYAVKYYDLLKNPCLVAGPMGKSDAGEMQIWTLEEFEIFVEYLRDKPASYMAFKILFWTGIRVGELLALTVDDFDYMNRMLDINKSYQRINGKDVITEPKTEKGKRQIPLPDFLVEEINEYIGKLYGIESVI